jgi:hypothetical protein
MEYVPAKCKSLLTRNVVVKVACSDTIAGVVFQARSQVSQVQDGQCLPRSMEHKHPSVFSSASCLSPHGALFKPVSRHPKHLFQMTPLSPACSAIRCDVGTVAERSGSWV